MRSFTYYFIHVCIGMRLSKSFTNSLKSFFIKYCPLFSIEYWTLVLFGKLRFRIQDDLWIFTCLPIMFVGFTRIIWNPIILIAITHWYCLFRMNFVDLLRRRHESPVSFSTFDGFDMGGRKEKSLFEEGIDTIVESAKKRTFRINRINFFLVFYTAHVTRIALISRLAIIWVDGIYWRWMYSFLNWRLAVWIILNWIEFGLKADSIHNQWKCIDIPWL